MARDRQRPGLARPSIVQLTFAVMPLSVLKVS
jgi:hypothetical protein